MTLLNNEIVEIGDKVFDVIHGYGTVVGTEFNEITVRFNNTGIRMSYTNKGYYGNARRLYWHNPIVINPPKHVPKWDTLVDCIKSIYNYLT